MQTICKECGCSFEARKNYKSYQAIFCGSVCAGIFNGRLRNNDVELVCVQCGEKFKIWKSEADRGRKCCSEPCRIEYMKFRDNRAYNWKGDDVGYGALHNWVWQRLGKPETCEHCGKTGLTGQKIHWANKSHEYKRELDDWIRLCRKCHWQYDHGITS